MIGSVGQIARAGVVFLALSAASLLLSAPVIGQTTSSSTSPSADATTLKIPSSSPSASMACKSADESLEHSARRPKDSGLAVSAGRRVLLHEDGTWQFPKVSEQREIDAITDTGRSVRLTETANENGCIDRNWTFVGNSSGVIQILVTRAITTDLSIHGNRDNCIPVIMVRNLNSSGLRKIIAEIEFSAPDGGRSSTSIMFGPIIHGEERERASAPLFVKECIGLTGVLKVPHCVLDNGADCQSITRASNRGVIPLIFSKD